MPYYTDSEADSPMPQDDGGDAPRGDDKEQMDGESTMIPASLCPHEVKPGDMVNLKCVAVHGDELEVQYAKDDGGDEMSPQDARTKRMSAMADKM